MLDRFDLHRRVRAAGVHLLLSGMVAAICAALVFLLWYPGPYRKLSGGGSLFLLVTTVDVIIGPLLTFAVFNPGKGWRHLRRDLAVIACLQFAALGYGLHTVYQVRPVALVFEKDRFRVVSAANVYEPELGKGRREYDRLPLTGPWTLGARPPREGAETTEAIFLALKGYDVAHRPIFWQPYDESKAEALRLARPLSVLIEHYPQGRVQVDATLAELKLDPDTTKFLPLLARVDAVVLLNERGDVAGFAPFDGFF
ncbi:MAG: pilus assembly protein [Sterolibacteriaceae bacterium]|nr:pilus assembly protein [Sterolibacteriaceae bacterium]MBK9084027.1 pilus assembly protein [Sterolibacteriaceae bacterium]